MGTAMTDPDLARLREQVRALAVQLGKVGQCREAPYWMLDDADEFARQLDELRDWVKWTLLPEFGGYCQGLLGCWADHPECRWELSTLRAQWLLAHNPPSHSLPDMAMWLNNYLPGTMRRLTELLGPCRGANGCTRRI